MPLIDLPLEELHRYGGRNPRPPDFDDYWARGLDELDQLDPSVELVAVDLGAQFADCFHLYFTGAGGARVHAKLLRPRRRDRPGPALLQFHGYSGNSGDWSDKLGYVAHGFTVAALDCRGQGGLSEDTGGHRGNTQRGHIIRGLDHGPENLLYRQIFLDTALLARIVMQFDEVDAARVGVTGASQGGALALVCAALEPRIARCAPIFPFLCDYRRVWEMDLATNAYEELRSYFRLFDPRHEREQEVFERLGYIDVQFLAERVRSEVLFFVGLMDAICPPSSQFAAYNRLLCPKSLVVYPDFGHEPLPGASDRIFRFMADLATPKSKSESRESTGRDRRNG